MEEAVPDLGIVLRSRKLQHRLEMRPFDIRAVEELVDIAYAERNDDACIMAIDRSFKLDLGTLPRHYVMYGRSYIRRWRRKADPAGKYWR